MKYKDWSHFVVHCSGIHEIMKRPRGATNLNKAERKVYDRIIKSEDLTDSENALLDKYERKIARYKDPELSKQAMKYLIKRYAWEKYNKKVAATGVQRSFLAKGNELEDEAIELLSTLDKMQYVKIKESKKNEYLLGCCDVFCESENKIIDVKTAWNINTFLPMLIERLNEKYWYQMQGYLELYNASIGEVCYVLLNTPPHLIERERAKYTEKYVFGEIPRERYDEEMEKLDLAFNYDKIPIKRKVIRFTVERQPEVLSKIYHQVDKCRVWLNEFERLHMNNKNILTLQKIYADLQEDNPEPDPADARESD